MTSKIIECRYATADIQTETSDYQCNLKYFKDLVMEEGDALQIKNTFIDTQQESGGKIVVKAPITAQMEYIKYFYKNQDSTALPFRTYDPLYGNLTYGYFSQFFNTAGQMMFYSKNVSQLDNPTEIITIGNISNTGGQFCQGNMTITYTVPGETKQSSQTIPVTQGLFGTLNNNVGIIYNGDLPITIKNSDPDTKSSIINVKNVSGPNGFNLVPVIFQTQITIPAGNYEPTDLATEINRQIQSSNIQNGEQGTQNAQPTDAIPNPYATASNFLTTERQSDANVRYLITLGDNGATDDGSSQVDVADVDTMSLLLGASQMELAWDPDLNAFSWNYLHMPYYTAPVEPGPGVAGVPAQPAVGFIKSPFQTSDDPNNQFIYMSVTAQSGIVFTSLSSSYPDGSEANLWDGMLGFQLQADTSKGEDPANNLLVKISRQRKVKTLQAIFVPDQNTTIEMEIFSLDRIPAQGKQITTGFMGLNSLLNKNQANWYQPNPDLIFNFLSTTTDTNNILGRQILLSSTQNLYNFGYFLIALQAGFKSDFYDKESKENIMAIVSRYYEANSFTSGTSDDSVVYVHKGSPTTLSSIGVKILLPDKTLAQNIGTGSSIFVELIKNQSQ
jgi:hypothetical protein